MEITDLDAFLAYWAKVHGRTRRVLDAVPEEHLEHAARPGQWTIGDLVRHLACLERYMFAENAAGRPSRYAGCGADLAAGKAAVTELFERLDGETVDIFRGLGNDRLRERCTTPGGASLPVWKWLRAMVEHHAHHRGQIHLHLALLGVPAPPLYGLSAEEVEARSTDG